MRVPTRGRFRRRGVGGLLPERCNAEGARRAGVVQSRELGLKTDLSHYFLDRLLEERLPHLTWKGLPANALARTLRYGGMSPGFALIL